VGNSRGARKLARTPHVNKKKMIGLFDDKRDDLSFFLFFFLDKGKQITTYLPSK
jgi:hypothetical protein